MINKKCMKRLGIQNMNLIAMAVTTLFAGYLVITVLTFHFRPEIRNWRDSKSWSWPDHSDTAFGGIFMLDQIDPNQLNSQLAHAEDSIRQIREELKAKHNSKGAIMGGYEDFGFAVILRNRNSQELTRKIENLPSQKRLHDSVSALIKDLNASDSFSSAAETRLHELADRQSAMFKMLMDSALKTEQQDVDLHFLAMGNYSLDPDSKFFIRNKTYNLAYLKWDTIVRNGDTSISGHYLSKPLAVRYIPDRKKILIPVSKSGYDFWRVAIPVLGLLLAMCMAYVYIGLPIHILLSISSGYAFTEKNIRALHTITLVLVIHATLTIFLPYIIRAFYSRLIPRDFELPSLGNRIMDHVYMLLIAVVLLAIARAFKKGYRLQQEIELTV